MFIENTDKDWKKVMEIEIINKDGTTTKTTKEASPEIIAVNEVERDGVVHFFAVKWARKEEKPSKKQKLQVDSSISSDRNIPMKCDICGKTYPMGQLTHDSNFGYVCKKCENEETC